MFRSNVLPAGCGDKMQYLTHRFNDNTIRFVLTYPGIPNTDLLKKAVRALIMSVDVLHASFRAGILGAHWHVHPQPKEDHSFRVLETADDPLQEALQQAMQPVLPQNTSRMLCTLVHNGHTSALAVCISHLCVDGADGKYLLQKLAEAYSLLINTGSCEGLQVKNGSRASEQLYVSLSREQLRSLMRNPMSGIKNAFPFPSEEDGTPHAVYQTLSAQTMSRAHSLAKEQGATVNDLLFTACYHALAEQLGANAPMSLLGMMDLRRHCAGGDSPGFPT